MIMLHQMLKTPGSFARTALLAAACSASAILSAQAMPLSASRVEALTAATDAGIQQVRVIRKTGSGSGKKVVRAGRNYDKVTGRKVVVKDGRRVVRSETPKARDHRNPGPVVRDHREPAPVVVRDHRNPSPVVRDHRESSPVVRDHRVERTNVRDHRVK